ncbi:MAG TPA: phage holin family protein [Stellaceae bacterium]|jgi:Putative Actinobacterial Holin-X, holin superfamily III|nr:phage holin family protein [Stellaceae bacterium]
MAIPGRSLPDIFSDLIAQFTRLLQKEGQLARAEVSENIGKAATGLGFVIGGAVLLIPALVVLLDAAVAAITERGHLAPYWSALIVGGAVLIIGLLLLAFGASRLRPSNMIPARTIQQLQRDASVAKSQFEESHELHRAA